MDNELIKIAYAPNDKHTPLALVSMTSVMENTSCEVEFIILYSELDEKSRNILNSITKYKNCKIIFQKVDETQFKGFPSVHWVTIQAWFRVLLPDLFPQYNKILYLDCDTLIRGDIKELYNKDVSGVLAAVVKDLWGIKDAARRSKLDDFSYFNSGVMLINCEKWRQLKLFDKIINYLKTDKDYKYGDQDSLNYAIGTDKICLHVKYNFMEGWWYNYWSEYEGQDALQYEQAKKDPFIIHYTAYKPNTPRSWHSMKDEWWNCAKKTDFFADFAAQYMKDCEEFFDDLFKQGKLKF